MKPKRQGKIGTPLSQKKEQLSVVLPKDLVGYFANVVNINATKSEVFFDFIVSGPAGQLDCKVVSRIIMSKHHSTQFARVLNKFIKKLK